MITGPCSITLPQPGLPTLQEDARTAGYTFIDSLVTEWLSGTQRFQGPGELLSGCFAAETLIATGGLTRDPFLNQPAVGRIRKVYVLSIYRNQGLGAGMVRFLLGKAAGTFSLVRLRAENADAARLYERLGFHPIHDPDATHHYHLP